MTVCTHCEQPIDPSKGHVYTATRMASGRVTGEYHKACYKRRRRQLSK